MRSDNRTIDDEAFFIDFELECLEYSRPVPSMGPVREPVVHGFPRPESFREIPPWRTSLHPIEYRIDEGSIVELWGWSSSLGYKTFNDFPLPVSQCMAAFHNDF